MAYTHDPLEWLQDFKSKRYDFMTIEFKQHSHIFTTCFEPNRINNETIHKFLKLFECLPKDVKAVLLVNIDTDNAHVLMLNKFIPTFKYYQLLHEPFRMLPTQSNWTSDADKFVCLTGIPTRYNRYKLIVELDKHNLLKHCVYSLQLEPSHKEVCLNMLSIADADIYSKDFMGLNSNPDNIEWYPSAGAGHSVPSSIMDTDILTNKLFRLVSETLWDNTPGHKFITEKTWYTIGYKLPFIIAGQAGTCKFLKQLGFNTFDDWLIQPYDNIQDGAKRMEAIIKNTEHWIKTLKTSNGVREAVEHNYNRMLELGHENEEVYKSAFSIIDEPYPALILSIDRIDKLKETIS